MKPKKPLSTKLIFTTFENAVDFIRYRQTGMLMIEQIKEIEARA
jgi:hypothetical protein